MTFVDLCQRVVQTVRDHFQSVHFGEFQVQPDFLQGVELENDLASVIVSQANTYGSNPFLIKWETENPSLNPDP